MGPNVGFLMFARPHMVSIGQSTVLHLAVTVIRHAGDANYQSNNTLNFKVFKP
jgi:hypothetical protein